MAGSVSATAKSAVTRGALLAIGTALATFATAQVQIDDDCKRGKGKEAKARYAECKKQVEEREDDALWAAILAGLAALGIRAGAEGGIDARRQAQGNVKPSDVQ
ncbi:hypothetical protein [Nocardioides antri]|uniref:Uncharacterized protein n=1 Tax=Nocardioides antri TaxID=2607659 RepID=A0A5B1M481_9ACTN|nr:hypothetical protein [Nocardioides antri]KAA1427723.1 hypothetical protein F0U47_09810 [Nocardioides antri]